MVNYKYRDKEHPKQNITIGESTPITDDSINSIVTLPENGISSCTIRANNELGRNYLAQCNLADLVTVKYAYEEDNPDGIDWETIDPVFVGNIIELQPSMDRTGEIVSLVAMNVGYSSKQMRVAHEYGEQSVKNGVLINDDLEVYGWTFVTNDFTHVNTTPWLQPGDDSYISALAIGFPTDEYYTFQTIDSYYKAIDPLTPVIYVKLRGRIGGTTPVHVHVKIYVWDGSTWLEGGGCDFTSTSWQDKVSGVYLNDLGFDTMEKINGARLKLHVDEYQGTDDTWVNISEAYLHVEVIAYPDKILKTLREILCDSDDGIVPRYIEKILNTSTDSGYSLDTDYVYNDSSNYSYLNFPYQDAFMCIQDIIRLGSRLHYLANPSSWKGLHWIINSDGQLLMAPVGNHNVQGIDGDHVIEDIWPTRVTNEPLVVREDMITQAFKTEIPLANYVLVAGKFIHPKGEIWTEGHAKMWSKVYPIFWPDGSITDDSVDKIIGVYSLKVDRGGLVGAGELGIVLEDLDINITALASTIGTVPKLLIFMRKEAIQWVKIRLCTDDFTKYFELEITNQLGNDDDWNKLELAIGERSIDEGITWEAVNSPSWEHINKIWIAIYAPAIGWTKVWLDGLFFSGNVLRGAYDSVSIGSDVHCRFLTIKDSLASTDTLDPDDDTSPLAQLALYELLRNRVTRTTGQISIPLDVTIMPGQIVHIHTLYNPDYTNPDTQSHYEIDKDFRITEHALNFAVKGVISLLKLTDDLLNSIPIDTRDPYTVVMRAINPDYQTRTYASLKTGGDFTAQQIPVSKDYPSS